MRNKPRVRCAKSHSGLALILVLWVLLLLTLIAGSFAFAMRTETVVTGNLTSRIQAGALAEAGIARAIFGLMNSGEDLQFPVDGKAHILRLDNAEVRVVIRAEQAKIDLNRAPDNVLRQLGEHMLGVEERDAFADSLLDWRDRNDLRRLNGAEDDDYEALGLPYGARDGYFMSVRELTQIPMITGEVFERLAPLVTVDSKARRIHAPTATRDALLSVPGLTPEAVDGYLLARANDETKATAALTYLGAATGLVDTRERRRGSGTLNIAAQGRTVDGAIAHRQTTVRIRRSGRRRVSILAWSRTAVGVDFATHEELMQAHSEEGGPRQ
ncbi:MAG: general secretion pathway protein GspK [Gammaproteobacteria bacterium]|nr:general secretion pathway protein GspK [Gammaproteobacteria bacterium]